MRKITGIGMLVLCLCFSVWYGRTLCVSAKSKTAKEVTADMGTGWNLGNTLDCYSYSSQMWTSKKAETAWGNPVTTKKMIDAVAKAGFRSIRIPITYYNHLDSKGKIDSAWLKRIGQIVRYGLDNDLYVIINVHHDTGNQGWIYADKNTYQTDLKNLKNIWKQVAVYFKDYDEKLLFEGINEILNTNHNWDWTQSYDDFRVAHDLNQEFIHVVRKTGGKNASRCLILNTWGASTDSCQIEQMFYKSFTDTVKNRLIVGVHSYMTSENSVNKVIPLLKGYSEKYGMPFIISEFGTPASVPMKNRILFASTYVKTAKKAGIPCFWWDNGADYSILDRSTCTFRNQDLVNAMVVSAK